MIYATASSDDGASARLDTVYGFSPQHAHEYASLLLAGEPTNEGFLWAYKRRLEKSDPDHPFLYSFPAGDPTFRQLSAKQRELLLDESISGFRKRADESSDFHSKFLFASTLVLKLKFLVDSGNADARMRAEAGEALKAAREAALTSEERAAVDEKAREL
jgi:hypothetical protein